VKRTPLAICAVAFCAISAAAIAADPLGFYIGGSAGEADFRGTSDISGPTLIFDERHPGWKVFVGARPIPFLGFEVAYTDLGNAHAPGPPVIWPAYFNDSSKQSAVTAFGVGYLPPPRRTCGAQISLTVQAYKPSLDNSRCALSMSESMRVAEIRTSYRLAYRGGSKNGLLPRQPAHRGTQALKR
jgi:hypothetical protein